MTTVPDIRYARSGDVAIAYQVVGDGPVDLVFVPFFGNIRWIWEQPRFSRFLERLASFSRLILFDKRGTGLSDRPRTLTLETQMDDIRAVLDAVGSQRAALLGAIQGSQLCALFAATYPDRTRGLVLYHPHAAPSDLPRRALPTAEEARDRWGTRELADEIVRSIMPSLADDEAMRRWWEDSMRLAASPSAAAEFFRMLRDTDITDVLPTIRVPTLVLHRGRWRDTAQHVVALIPARAPSSLRATTLRSGPATTLPPKSSASWRDESTCPSPTAS
jgi:pimeloyl-ACP methyl ester carboxylesterase